MAHGRARTHRTKAGIEGEEKFCRFSKKNK